MSSGTERRIKLLDEHDGRARPPLGFYIGLAIFAGLTVVYLWPIWETMYLPHQDGPVHLHNVKMLRDYWSGTDPAVAEIYRLNDWLVPTWFGHLLFYVLTEFVSYFTAQKLVVSAYLLALPLSLVYASRAYGGGAVFPAVFGFAVASNTLLNLGFYMFCWGMVIAMVTVGYWMRRCRTADPRSALILGVLGLLLYHTHMVGFVMVTVAIGVVTLVSLVQDARVLTPRVVINRIGWPLLCWLPAVVMLLLFLLPRQSMPEDAPSALRRLVELGVLTSVASFELYEFFVTGALMLGLCALAALLLVRRVRSAVFEPSDIWLLIACAWLAVYFVAPNTILVSEGGWKGGGYIINRLQLFPVLALVIWVAAQPLNRTLRVGSVATAAILAFLLAGMRIQFYRDTDSQFAEYVSIGSKIKSGNLLLPILLRSGGAPGKPFSPTVATLLQRGEDWTMERFNLPAGLIHECGGPVSRFVNPFRHASSYLALQYGVQTLDNYEATTGYFPLVFRHEYSPYHLVGDVERVPSDVRFSNPKSQVDYVLIWPTDGACQPPSEIAKELAKFELVGSSTPRGLATVYRRATGG